ncbi:MAG: glucosamine-6-phosphate deaminase [Bacillota bacterium]|jgi:glucosamine-6-phosphate deaminase
MQLITTKDYQDMSRIAANIIAAQITLHPRSVLGLATGSTPLGIYQQLVQRHQAGDIDFAQIRSVNLDEYCGLAPDHPNSYHYYMWENLFRHVNVKPENVHIPDGLAEDVAAECARYERLIEGLGGIDLQLLGLGENGHIGFNEPAESFTTVTHQVELDEQTIVSNSRLFASVDEVPRSAITMGIKAIMQARKVILVVNGVRKAAILKKALYGPVTPRVPASILQLHPDVTVVADAEALSEI